MEHLLLQRASPSWQPRAVWALLRQLALRGGALPAATRLQPVHLPPQQQGEPELERRQAGETEAQATAHARAEAALAPTAQAESEFSHGLSHRARHCREAAALQRRRLVLAAIGGGSTTGYDPALRWSSPAPAAAGPVLAVGLEGRKRARRG